MLQRVCSRVCAAGQSTNTYTSQILQSREKRVGNAIRVQRNTLCYVHFPMSEFVGVCVCMLQSYVYICLINFHLRTFTLLLTVEYTTPYAHCEALRSPSADKTSNNISPTFAVCMYFFAPAIKSDVLGRQYCGSSGRALKNQHVNYVFFAVYF